MNRLHLSFNKACCREQAREHRKSDSKQWSVPVRFQDSELNYVNNSANDKILDLTSTTVIRYRLTK